MTSRERFCAILCHMVNLLMYSTMLHICKITYVAQLGVNGHNFKMRPFCTIMLLHIRRFVSGICNDAGDEKYWSLHHTHRTLHLVYCIVLHIWGFRVRQYLRSLAPVMNGEWWLQWWQNDIRRPWGPKASRHLSYRWRKTRKKPHSGNLSRPGNEPGPAAW